jgi:segregation and condensation protein B
MDISHIIPHIEALIFASDKPLTMLEITELINGAFGFMEDKVTTEQVETSMQGIVEKYNAEFYPFEVRESGGGWQFLTKRDFHKTVAQLNGDKFLKRLSNAALETLAIIAYKHPITKSEIESIRGVNSDYSIQKLLEKELIIISGRNEAMPGKPLVYATSKSFMDYFGLNNAEDLPKIREVLAEQMVEPTEMANMFAKDTPEAATPDEKLLVVTEDGAIVEHISDIPTTEPSETIPEDETPAEEPSADHVITVETPEEVLIHEASPAAEANPETEKTPEASDTPNETTENDDTDTTSETTDEPVVKKD